MLATLLELLLAPLLVGISTVAAYRWEQRVGGVVSAFPAIVGPLLLIAATSHGSAFAARTATGIVLGLVALSGFTVAYAATSRHRSWPWALAAGWLVAVVLSAIARAVDPTAPEAIAFVLVAVLAAAADRLGPLGSPPAFAIAFVAAVTAQAAALLRGPTVFPG